MSEQQIDNRMVKCVLEGHTECLAKIPEACLCYQMQQTPSHRLGNLYEERYRQKYGEEVS